MAGIFTRPEIAKILNDENLTADERTDRIMSLRGRDLDESYVTKSAARAAQEDAIAKAREAWSKEQKPVKVEETEEYKKLLGEYEGYKTKQTARTSPEYAGVKPKFFDRVYDLIDRTDGAKPVPEQLDALRKDFEEYFTVPSPAEGTPAPKLPQFGGKPEGSMPKGQEGAVAAFTNAWGFKKH